MKRTVSAILLVCFALSAALFVPACRLTEPDAEPAGNNGGKEEENMGNRVFAAIEVEGYGTIELELYPEIAPQSVYNFCYLARQGYYDGVTFHRVIKGFMIQGGDPDGNGLGGPGYCIKGEFSLNGFENELKHERGVLSMARKERPYNSAGSQFFICQEDSPHLDGAYAAFGKVLSGMEIVDAIAEVEVNSKYKPLTPVVITSITITGPELPEPEKIPETTLN